MPTWLKRIFRIGVYSRRDEVAAFFDELQRYGVAVLGSDNMAELMRSAQDWRAEFAMQAQVGLQVGIRVKKKSDAQPTSDILRTVLVRHGFTEEHAEATANNVFLG